MAKKDEATRHSSILAVTGLSAKATTDFHAHVAGNVVVFEVSFSGGSTFIKVRGSQVEVGGTADWGSGTIALG